MLVLARLGLTMDRLRRQLEPLMTRKRGFILFYLIFIGPFMGFAVYATVVQAPQAAAMQADLEREFRTIPQVPGSIMTRYTATHKSQTALVVGAYNTSADVVALKTYYDAELGQRGWSFLRQKEVRDWGRDTGSSRYIYCKGDRSASLDYSGEPQRTGWVFTFDMNWGLNNPCEPWKVQ